MRVYYSFLQQRFVIWLTLLALVLHSLIPVGYMPTPSGTGLMICDGVHHHPTSSPNPSAPANDICPFSALVFAGTLDIAAPVLPSPQAIAWTALLIALISAPLYTRNVAYARPRAPPLY